MSSGTPIQFQVKGWQAIALLVLLIGLLGYRFVSFQDLSDNEAFMRSLNASLLMDYLPGETERVLAAVQAGDPDALEKTQALHQATHPMIDSIQASYPLLSLSSEKDVIVKVVYSLQVGEELREPQTVYLHYTHHSLGNSWIYQHRTTATRYFMNFL